MDHNIDLTLLDFANFENQLKFLLSQFGVTVDSVPSLNASINLENDQQLTLEETNIIKTAYQADYDFFASKGITFP